MRGLIGKHAMLGAGLWGGGLMVCVLGSGRRNFQKPPLGMELGGGVGYSNKLVWGHKQSKEKEGGKDTFSDSKMHRRLSRFIKNSSKDCRLALG